MSVVQLLDAEGRELAGPREPGRAPRAWDSQTDAASRLLAVGAALESGSEHPIARAVLDAAAGVDVPRRLPSSPPWPDRGCAPWWTVAPALAGRPELLRQAGVELPDALVEAVDRSAGEGRTVVLVAAGAELLGAILVADTLRDSSVEAVARMRADGVRTVLLTGDNAGAARFVAERLGIDEVHADVPPAGKLSVIEELRGQGRKVAMIGDGVNDAAALAGADLGVSMGTGTDVAIAASDITLTRADLGLAVDALHLSRATLRTIHQNLFWAFAYNVVAIPVAALGYLNPMVACGGDGLLLGLRGDQQPQGWRGCEVGRAAPVRVDFTPASP
ncbi:MAG: HAD-IC family P-type ATPase [Acidipropionibacterium sp.]|jgi:Cu+-exporting ATPase|nr:HAD-IC family P-type ATPase [Acidipropionibacterium sp.]